MTEERQFDYDALLHEAFREAQRGVMRAVLTRVAEHGLPGEHHFYISFNTEAPGVSIAPRLLQKYPHEMTIVLQHRFWDLIVQDDRFEVKLTFDSIRERLVVPFTAVRMFFDPSVPYGLQFEEPQQEPRGGAEVMGFAPQRGGGRGSKSTTDKKKSTRKTKIEAAGDADESAATSDEAATERPAAKPAVAHKADGATAAPAAKTGPRLVETSANDSAKVVSLDQFRKK